MARVLSVVSELCVPTSFVVHIFNAHTVPKSNLILRLKIHYINMQVRFQVEILIIFQDSNTVTDFCTGIHIHPGDTTALNKCLFGLTTVDVFEYEHCALTTIPLCFINTSTVLQLYSISCPVQKGGVTFLVAQDMCSVYSIYAEIIQNYIYSYAESFH